ncbi:hypothetical protein BH11MYX1_BH11MYX1_16700 [soil metagenome]
MLEEQHAKLDTAIQAAKSDKNLGHEQRTERVKQLETQQGTVAGHLDRISGAPKPEAAKLAPATAAAAKHEDAHPEHRIHVIA